MSLKSHIPFYRQISGSLIFLYLSFVILIGVTSFLLYQRNIQINELVNVQIPELEFTSQYKALFKRNNELVITISESETSDDLTTTFYNIKENLQDVSNLNLINVRNINRLISELNDINSVVERVVANDSRNHTLKQTSVVQFNILINTLVTQIELKNQEHKALYRKVTINGANGYIPAGDAIKYVEFTRVLTQLNKSLVLFDEAVVGFEALSMKYTVDQLEEITRKIDLAITIWLSALSNDAVDMDIRHKIEELQTLLSVEQRVLGKWYSHLRLSEEIFNRVTLINQKLIGLYPSENSRINFISSDYIIPKAITQLAAKVDYKITAKTYYYSLIGLLAFSLLTILLLLLKFRSRVRVYGENTVELCASILSDEGTTKDHNVFVKTAEQLRIVGLIEQIQKPEHSENQYQLLNDLHIRDLTFLNKHHHISMWQYQPFHTYIDVVDFLSALNIETDDKVTHWKQLFTRQAFTEIICVAKQVRDSKIAQSYSVEFKQGIQLEVLIDFDGISWFGTLSHPKKVELLKSSLRSLKEKQQNIEAALLAEKSSTVNKFNQMTLRAMLQSQSSSIDVSNSNLPVYRQLTRMLDWCEQSDLVSQLNNTPKKVQTIDISFEDELYAIIFNAIAEANPQRNQIQLKLDKKILPYTNIDHLLFHKMLMSLMRVTLAELFNAKMLVDIKVIDKDQSKQLVQFTLHVLSAKPLRAMPGLVNKLINGEKQSGTSSNIITYLQVLMERLSIKYVQGKLNDDGFNVAFSLPLIAHDIHPINEHEKNTKCKDISALLVGVCPQSTSIISHHLHQAGGKVKTLNDANQLIKAYTPEKLEHKPVSVIIVNDDIARTNLDSIKKYQQSLPESIKPKLFVTQPLSNTQYKKHGLYGQASSPILKHSFINQLGDLLSSDSSDNLLISAEVLNQYQFLPSRVEVLLAVALPEKHQVLIRILHWLGLQVHVVSQPSAMTKYWQSGRYLVLLSEFSQSPFIQLLTGKNIQRGVLGFEDNQFNNLQGEALEISKHWKVSTLPDALDIKNIVELLKPWLKSKTTMTQTAHSPSVSDNQTKLYDAFLSETNKLDSTDKEYLEDLQLLNFNEKQSDESDLQNDVINIETYARNQGSSELAAYMLDEYIDDIESAIVDIEGAIKQLSPIDMQKPVQILLKLSEVMSANNLRGEVMTMQSLTENDTHFKDIASYNSSVSHLRTHLQALKLFSEAL